MGRTPDLEVREAPGKGRAVFALRNFRPGDLVMEITGQVISDRDGYGSLYCMDLRPGYVLEPHSPGGLVCHSCDPNCELVQESDNTMALYALVNIEPGREITYDYGWPAGTSFQRCRCGSVKCRGYIVEASDLRRHLRMIERHRSRRKAAVRRRR